MIRIDPASCSHDFKFVTFVFEVLSKLLLDRNVEFVISDLMNEVQDWIPQYYSINHQCVLLKSAYATLGCSYARLKWLIAIINS